MGVFDFFKKQKKEEAFTGIEAANDFVDTELNQDNDEGFASAGRNEDLGFKPRFNEPISQFQTPQQNTQSSGLTNSDIQLLLTKLDLINQRLEVIDRRLQVVEDIAKQSR